MEEENLFREGLYLKFALDQSWREHFRAGKILSNDEIPKSGTSGKCLKYSRIDSSFLEWLDNHHGRSPEGLWCSWLAKSPRFWIFSFLCALFLRGKGEQTSCRISSWNSQSKAPVDWVYLYAECTCWRDSRRNCLVYSVSHRKEKGNFKRGSEYRKRGKETKSCDSECAECLGCLD